MDKFQIYSQIITWLIILGGWVVVWYQIKSREERHEAWELIKEFKSIVRNMEEDALSYWTQNPSAPDCKELEFQIKANSKRLGLLNNIFALRKKELNSKSKIKTFRQSIMSGDFESNNRQKLDIGNIRLYEISGEANNLIFSLEKSFYQSF